MVGTGQMSSPNARLSTYSEFRIKSMLLNKVDNNKTYVIACQRLFIHVGEISFFLYEYASFMSFMMKAINLNE